MKIPTTVGAESFTLVSGENQDKNFKLLFDMSPLPMLVVDLSSFSFKMVNDAAVELYGYTKEEFLQMTFKELLPPNRLLSRTRIKSPLKKELNYSEERVHLKKDGTLLYVIETSKLLPLEEGGQRSLVVINDLTARKYKEQQQQEAGNQYNTLLRKIEEVVFSFNEKMEMTYVNPQVEAITGFLPGQFYVGKYLWFNLVHPADRHLFEEVIPKLRKSGESINLEHRIRTASGEEKWVITKCTATFSTNGRILRVDGTLSDITSRKRYEEGLRFSDFSLESSSEPLLWTKGNGQIIRVNRAASALLDYQEHELLGLSIFTISPTLDPEAWSAHWQAFEQLQSITIDTVLQAKNGQRKPVDMHWSHFVFRQESFGFISIREKSERKNADSEKTVKQIQHLQQFANIVSHNLSSPVANIVGLTNLYNHDNPQDPNNSVLIEKLERTTQRLVCTINDLNKLVAIKNKYGQILEMVDIEHELESVLENFEQELNSCQAWVNVDLAAGSLVMGVKGYINSIFFNLISNAIKYRSPNRDLEIHIKTVFSNGLLCLQVQDNGLGLDLPKLRNEIFGMYKRFHPSIEGKGLGLHMTKTQIESIGGWIEIDSAPDSGTTFKLYFQVPAKL